MSTVDPAWHGFPQILEPIPERHEGEAKEKAEKEAADAISFEKKRARLEEKEKLKAEGKWLSKKDLAKKEAQEARLAAMMDAGMIPSSSNEADNKAAGGGVIRNKKKNKNKQSA